MKPVWTQFDLLLELSTEEDCENKEIMCYKASCVTGRQLHLLSTIHVKKAFKFLFAEQFFICQDTTISSDVYEVFKLGKSKPLK